MGDAFTGTVAMGDIVQDAFDRLAYHALRDELYFDAVADVKPTRQSMPGDVVNFTKVADLSSATATLNESTDVDAVAMSDSLVALTLLEKGSAVITTAKLRGTAYIEVDPVVANVIGYNAGLSIDEIAGDVLVKGTNVRFATGGTTDPTARNTVEPNDTLVAADVRRARAELRSASVPTVGGGLYVAFIHPDVAFDLTGETGAASWRDPHVHSAPAEIWNGEMGTFEGFRFIETPRDPLLVADAGSSTTLTDVYLTIFLGRQALAKAFSTSDGNGPFPRVILGPVTDKLRRNVPIGYVKLPIPAHNGETPPAPAEGNAVGSLRGPVTTEALSRSCGHWPSWGQIYGRGNTQGRLTGARHSLGSQEWENEPGIGSARMVASERSRSGAWKVPLRSARTSGELQSVPAVGSSGCRYTHGNGPDRYRMGGGHPRRRGHFSCAWGQVPRGQGAHDRQGCRLAAA